MGMVDEQLCEQRQKTVDERCRREQKDMEKFETKQEEGEKRSEKLEELSIKMGEILKNHDEKLTNHDRRIVQLESTSGAHWNVLVNYMIAGMVGAMVSAAMRLILGG
jgi:hypothetical protein